MKITRIKIYQTLLFLYVCSLGFQTLLSLPYLGSKFQIPELLFLAILGVISFDLMKNRKLFFIKITSFDKIVFLLPFVVFFSSIVNEGFHAWLEWIGMVYLFSTFFLLKTVFSRFTIEQIYIFFYSGFLWSGCMLAISCLIGWGMLFFWEIPNSMAFVYEKYPYFGDVIRVHGFNPSPHMAASIFNISILFFFSKILLKKQIRFIEYFLMLLIIIAYIFTLAKVVIILLLAMLFMVYKKDNTLFSWTQKRILAIACFCTILLYIFATHFIIQKKQDIENEKILPEHFHVGYAIAESDSYYLIPTTYAALKKSAFYMGKENLFLGVGFGNHEFNLDQFRTQGLFPKHLENYPPHSTYFGGFAELGLVGLGGIIFIFMTFWKRLQILAKIRHEEPLVYVFWGMFFLVGIEAISTDILNFRHYWVLLAMLATLLERKSKNIL